jgi:hypothetical protein
MPHHKPIAVQFECQHTHDADRTIATLMASALLRMRNRAQWSNRDLLDSNRDAFLLGFGGQQSVNSNPVDFEE